MISVTLPWPPKELSPNARVHWSAKHRATKQYREACKWQAVADGVRPNVVYPVPLRIELEFVPPDRRSYDRDNLVARVKAGLDGLADALGVDDKHFRIAEPVIAEQIGGMVKVRVVEVGNAQADRLP